MIPLVITTFRKIGPSAQSHLQSSADVACSTGFVDRGVWLRGAKQFLNCDLVRGRGIVFRYYYKSIAKCAGKDFRDGAVVPFECVICLHRVEQYNAAPGIKHYRHQE